MQDYNTGFSITSLLFGYIISVAVLSPLREKDRSVKTSSPVERKKRQHWRNLWEWREPECPRVSDENSSHSLFLFNLSG